MNRFTLRTKPKVDVQWRLYAMVHNIGKIHAFGRLNEPSQTRKWRGYNPNTVKKSLRPAVRL